MRAVMLQINKYDDDDDDDDELQLDVSHLSRGGAIW